MSSQSTISPTATKRSLERVQSNLRAVAPLSARRHPGGSGGLRHTSLLRSDRGCSSCGAEGRRRIQRSVHNILREQRIGNDAARVDHDECKGQDARL